MSARTRNADRSARRWPRAAVWGGAMASTAMNLSANWHATTVHGITTFIAPTANGLHLPEVTKLAVSAAFPLLLIFAVESAARTSLRFRLGDLGSYAMPLGALTVFAFSVGEVTRLLLGMGQPVTLALLFALAPDILITAGTVVLMRERQAVPEVPPASVPIPVGQEDASCWDIDVFDPDLRSLTSRLEVPPPGEAPDLTPVKKPRVVTTREAPALPARREPSRRQDAEPSQDGSVTELPSYREDGEVFAAIEAYSREHGGLPTANWLKRTLRVGADRAKKLLDSYERVASQEATG